MEGPYKAGCRHRDFRSDRREPDVGVGVWRGRRGGCLHIRNAALLIIESAFRLLFHYVTRM